jgi:hypothetical protein
VGGWLADKIIGRVLDWFAKTIVGALSGLWDLLSGSVFVSPDVTQLPQVTAFASTSLGIVNVSYVLAFMWMAVLVLGRDTIQSTYGLGELIPRLVIGLIAANLAVPLCSALIEVANAVTAALTGQDITNPGSTRQLQTITAIALKDADAGVPTGFLLLVVGLLIAGLVAALVVQWIIRVGVLIVVVGIAPIALALHGTPHTEGAAKLWWRTLLGTLGTVVMQAVALHTTLTVFFNNPDPALVQIRGLPTGRGAVMNLLIVVCLLWGVVKIPSLMRRYITQTRPSAMGMIVRVVLTQQLTRGISRALGGVRGAVRVGSGRGAIRAGNGTPARGTGSGTADPRWPVTAGTGTRAPSSTGRSAPAGPVGRGTRQRLPRPTGSGSGSGRVRVVYPAGQPVRPYTRDELARGVDLYTRATKSRTTTTTPGKATP